MAQTLLLAKGLGRKKMCDVIIKDDIGIVLSNCMISERERRDVPARHRERRTSTSSQDAIKISSYAHQGISKPSPPFNAPNHSLKDIMKALAQISNLCQGPLGATRSTSLRQGCQKYVYCDTRLQRDKYAHPQMIGYKVVALLLQINDVSPSLENVSMCLYFGNCDLP